LTASDTPLENAQNCTRLQEAPPRGHQVEESGGVGLSKSWKRLRKKKEVEFEGSAPSCLGTGSHGREGGFKGGDLRRESLRWVTQREKREKEKRGTLLIEKNRGARRKPAAGPQRGGEESKIKKFIPEPRARGVFKGINTSSTQDRDLCQGGCSNKGEGGKKVRKQKRAGKLKGEMQPPVSHTCLRKCLHRRSTLGKTLTEPRKGKSAAGPDAPSSRRKESKKQTEFRRENA